MNDAIASNILRAAKRIISQPDSPFYSPGLVVAWSDGATTSTVAVGNDARGRRLGESTPFMLASASKLALALVVLRLVDETRISLDQPLSDFVKNSAAAHPSVTIRRLLSHTAGLPLEFDTSRVTYSTSLTRDQVIAECVRTPLAFEPGSIVQYSNVGYALLSLVVERTTRLMLQAALQHFVFDPLGIEAWVGGDAPDDVAAVAGIESPHVGTELEPCGPFWRSLSLPWANVSATAQGVLKLLRAYSSSGFLSSSLAAEATSTQTGGLAGGFTQSIPFLGFAPTRVITWDDASWGLGVELRGAKKPHWAPYAASPQSFGHIGSSGVLGWFEPATGKSWAICGCRTTDSGWLTRYGGALGDVVLRG